MDFLEIKPEKAKRIHQKEMGPMGHFWVFYGHFGVKTRSNGIQPSSFAC